MHDRQRARPTWEAALLDDLDWLGFTPDQSPTDAFRAGTCGSRQSDRLPHYEEAAGRLAAQGLLYGCDCSRQEVARARSATSTGTPRYPGTCRHRGRPLDAASIWRLRLPDDAVVFDDALAGPQRQVPAIEAGDVAIRDRHGNWTYQFAVSVDDHLQAIDLVVRGVDLLPSTGTQILIGRLLGRRHRATFAHHPLVMQSPTRKLSKSDGDTGVRDLRAAGWTPPQVIGAAAAAVGLAPAGAAIAAADVAALFTATG